MLFEDVTPVRTGVRKMLQKRDSGLRRNYEREQSTSILQVHQI
jgi:hypothetical protein